MMSWFSSYLDKGKREEMKRQDKKMNKGFPKVEEQEIKLGKKSTDDIQGTEDHAKYQEG